MKILKLRFQNLNSLQGEWEIDFRHAAYVDDGIFAITGATGAGKSTILDAICLALYGATPRLGDITQSNNDLMSRHTGECFSELIFSTNGKSYRCTWGQKKARKQAHGKLQSPKHEIATYISDDTDGTLLEEKASRTKARVEHITGMDFDRFTRAMLLAQGSFSAFLQASSDERSPILEQITGTGIYSDISKKVHEFRRNAEIDLTRLTDKLSGMTFLSEDESQTLRQQKQQLEQQITQLKKTISHTELTKTWRHSLTHCQQQIEQLTQEKQQLTKQNLAFDQTRQQLNNALKALEVAPLLSQFRYLQSSHQDHQATLQQLLEKQPNLQNRYEAVSHEQQSQEQAFLQSLQVWEAAQPLFNQVRQLDARLAQTNEQAQLAQLQLNKVKQQWTQRQATLTRQTTKLDALQTQHEQLASQNLPTDAAILPQTLATLRQLEQNWQNLARTQHHLVTEKTQLISDQTAADNEHQQRQQQLSGLTARLSDYQNQQQQLSERIAKLSGGQTLSDWRHHTEQYWQWQHNVQTLQQQWQTVTDNLHTYQQHEEQLHQITEQLTKATTQHQHYLLQQQHTSDKVDMLNQNLLLHSKIASLTEERQRLQAGQPCPLCGAKEHPFADHNPAAVQDSEQQLDQAKTLLNQLNAQLNQSHITLSNAQKDQAQHQQQQQQLWQANQTLASQMQLLATSLPDNEAVCTALKALQCHLNDHPTQSAHDNPNARLLSVTTEIGNILTQAQHHYQQQLNQAQQCLAALEKAQQAHTTLTSDIQTLSAEQSCLTHDQGILQAQQTHRKQRLDAITQQLDEIQQEQQTLTQRISALIAPLSDQSPPFAFTHAQDLASFAEMICQLEHRLQHHQMLQQEMQQLATDMHEAQQHISATKAEARSLQTQTSDWQQQCQLLTEQTNQLHNHRFSLFEQPDIEAEADKLSTLKDQHYQTWQASLRKLNDLQHQRQLLDNQIQTLQTTLSEQQAKLQPLTQQLQAQLQRLGFADAHACEQALLPQSERERLQQLAQEIQTKIELNHAALLAAEAQHQRQMTTPEIDSADKQLDECFLSAMLSAQQTELSEQQRKLGGIEQTLNNNQLLQQNQAALSAQILSKQAALAEWQHLHDLIGSSDGKKFRNFAQGLTFNIMIAHANDQLKKMSDRYLLLADETQPLVLNVMDNYQGGQVRTSKNLSGGESFIISLALALGLSNMASHRMQVDSLFLDEGFGTLDEEALDVALDTLAHLQQSGKLIGVISHIQALKDRISHQIQVLPQTGGISKIIGAGVQRLS